MRFTAAQYETAIEALRDGAGQLAPDGRNCRICHDSGHQAWECGHNPLLAMAMCEGIAKSATELHDRLHAIEETALANDVLEPWLEDAHGHLHSLAGYDSHMGAQTGPARIVVPAGETPP